MDLDETTKERILLEEKYRSEIERQFKLSKPEENKVTKFLNSSFGLWLLSAIFITGVGSLYQNWQSKKAEEQLTLESKLQSQNDNRQAIERLDLEIGFRISQALLYLSTVSERVEATMRDSGEDEKRLAIADSTFEVINELGSTIHNSEASLYPEHVGYPLSTLLVELRRRLEVAEQSVVEESLAALSNLATSMNFGKSKSVPEDAAGAILDRIVLERWTNSAFEFIHCNSKQPFCE